MPFGVRFFLLLAEKHFFLALIRKSCRADYFLCFTERGSFPSMTKQREGGKSCMGVPSNSVPPSLSAVPLLRGRRGRIYTDFLLRYLTTAL